MESQDLEKAVANLGSTIIILLCAFIKVPQIIYVKDRKSSEGVYLQAMLMELTGFTIITLYNFTNQYGLMTYLEYPIILLQLYALFYYVLKYKRMLHQPIVTFGTCFYIGFVMIFLSGMLPKSIISYLLPICTPLSGFAKVTYIYGIIKAGNADAVSLMTWIISTATNCARIFTVFSDSGDWKLMLNFFISSLLSVTVLTIASYYQSFWPGPCQRKPPRRRSHAD